MSNEPATQAQINLLARNNVDGRSLTKQQASDAIGNLPASPKQVATAAQYGFGVRTRAEAEKAFEWLKANNWAHNPAAPQPAQTPLAQQPGVQFTPPQQPQQPFQQPGQTAAPPVQQAPATVPPTTGQIPQF